MRRYRPPARHGGGDGGGAGRAAEAVPGHGAVASHYPAPAAVSPQIILGKVVSRKAKMDLGLAKNLVLAGNEFGGYMTVMGKTISTDDFYEVSVHCRKK